ncbi:3932_t:CDS:2 [Racocetra fulgida]|uniref:3932_t:CDS:1 n=1 Tax=Racocetra fulgida TaxID=60492 RepID=A0A9N8ZKB7_9GLOM|nr:3932_t:CDS:2 [Racocetra fulgida]
MQLLSKNFEYEIATRMQAHLNYNCLGAPENAKSKSKNQLTTPINISTSTSSYTLKWLKTILIYNFIDHLSEGEQESLEFILFQSLFAIGVPFAFLKNPYVPIGYNAFTKFANLKFEQENSVKLFVEIVKFRNKSSPYDDYIFWESATMLDPVKKLVYVYENLRIYAEKPVNNKIDTRINNSKVNQINQEIYNDEDIEIDNIIYKEGICKGIEEEIEPIYLSDIDNNSGSIMELELSNE